MNGIHNKNFSFSQLPIHMSASHPLSSSSSEPKKKFGKNLNKLSKPPPPPTSTSISASSRGGATGGNSSSRNGLLLLSTKRASSSFGASSTSSTGSLLASKPKTSVTTSFGSSSSSVSKGAPRPLNTPSLRSETSYDTLLNSSSANNAAGTGLGGWVNGSTTNEVASNPPQPAWGLGDKTAQPSPVQSTSSNIPTLAPKGRVSAGYHASISPAPANAPLSVSSSAQHNEENEGSALYPYEMRFPRRQKHERISKRRIDSYENDGFVTNSRKHEFSSSNQPSEIFIAPVISTQFNNVDDQDNSLNISSQSQKDNERLRNKSFSGEQAEKSIEDNAGEVMNGSNNADLLASAGISSKDCKSKSVYRSDVDGVIPKDDNLSHNPNSTLNNSNTNSNKAGVDDQVEFMKRRARERAEVLRLEEEARVNAQKERAARRLKKLEEKMSASSSNGDFNGNKRRSSPPSENWRSKNTSRKNDGEIVLERLGNTKDNGASRKASKATSENISNSTSSRTLFDPSRTYSSLVGGSKVSRVNGTDFGGKLNFQKNPPNDPPLSTVSHPLNDPPILSLTVKHDISDDNPPPVSVIQLSTFKDRMRGERGNLGGPRMLFDPKSGSMIQAPSFDKRNAHNYNNDDIAPKGRRDRAKPKTRAARERESKSSSESKRIESVGNHSLIEEVDRRKHDNTDDFTELRMSRRENRKDDSNAQWRDRRRYEKSGSSKSIDTHENRGNAIGHEDAMSNKHNSKRHGSRNAKGRSVETLKLPRTCGVLYKLDDHGNYTCADGCDADLGYGAHSVPGGRVRNPIAYVPYIEQQRLLMSFNELAVSNKSVYEQWKTRNMHHQHNSSSTESFQTKDNHYQQFITETERPGLFIHGNHSHEQYSSTAKHALGKEQMQENSTLLGEISYDVPSHMKVKANETLSILEGVPDSPELQATAHPWAPSEAALAAAAAAATAASLSRNYVDEETDSDTNDIVAADLMKIIDESDHSDDTSELNSDSSFYGLGFDPTENMDSMITSPTLTPGNIENTEALNISTLSLGPAVKMSSKVNGHPFSPLGSPSRFLGSSTWGTGMSLGRSPHANVQTSLSTGSLNWDFVNADIEVGPPETSLNGNRQELPTASSFLGLSTLTNNQDGSTWGSSRIRNGIIGLGGTPLGNSASGDGANIVD